MIPPLSLGLVFSVSISGPQIMAQRALLFTFFLNIVWLSNCLRESELVFCLKSLKTNELEHLLFTAFNFLLFLEICM